MRVRHFTRRPATQKSTTKKSEICCRFELPWLLYCTVIVECILNGACMICPVHTLFKWLKSDNNKNCITGSRISHSLLNHRLICQLIQDIFAIIHQQLLNSSVIEITKIKFISRLDLSTNSKSESILRMGPMSRTCRSIWSLIMPKFWI